MIPPSATLCNAVTHSVRPNLFTVYTCPIFCFSLAQHRVWCAWHLNPHTLAVLFKACGMVNLAPHVQGIHPYEIIRFYTPHCLKLLLADRAGYLLERDILRDTNVAVFGLLLRLCASGGSVVRVVRRE